MACPCVATMRTRSAPTSSRPGSSALVQHFAPGIDRAAREQRRDVPAAIDRRDMEGVGEAIEGQRAGQRDHVPAIDQPPAEAAAGLRELVEMHLGGVLVEPGGQLCSASSTVMPSTWSMRLADGVVVPAVRPAGERRSHRRRRRSRGRRRPAHPAPPTRGSVGTCSSRDQRARIALAHHHPADIVEHRRRRAG